MLYGFIFSFLFAILLTNNVLAENIKVRGYSKKNGTYVQGHNRTKANKYKYDNYSNAGSVNPYNGKKGKVRNKVGVL